VKAQDSQVLKIGTVDLNRIADSSKKHKKAMDVLKEDVEVIKNSLQKLEQKMKELLESKKNCDDPVKKKEIEVEIEKIKIEGVTKAKKGQEELEARQKAVVEGLYKEICTAIGSFAKENGYGMVMVDLGTEVKGDSVAKILEKINIRTVIYADKKYDITDEIIKCINKE
jgi:Skp family chaperone for outer membrane proteins